MDRRHKTLQSLAGLSAGDGFGETLFMAVDERIAARELPEAPWGWTDDTHMALSIVDELLANNGIEPDSLAQRFAQRFAQEPWRGYGGGAQHLLRKYASGASWREEAPKLFGEGSFGNGGAMRCAPIGAYFVGDPGRAAEEARKSAMVTHAHIEGQAGAMATAASASLLAAGPEAARGTLLSAVIQYVPESDTRAGIQQAAQIGRGEFKRAVLELGTGRQVAAFDTVPFCLWVATHFGGDYEDAMWTTVAGRGDQDTTCAIVGGMIGATTAIPGTWIERREPLPPGYDPTP